MDNNLQLLFLLHCSSLCFISSAYTDPDKYFINCGSSRNFTEFGRTFVGDVTPNSFPLCAKHSEVANTANPSSELYRTARTFKRRSSYRFRIPENGTYLVRLHFFPPKLFLTALFNVSVFGSNLLENFTLGNNRNSAVVREFLVSIDVEILEISFEPQKQCCAFVNAIEVFVSPDGFIPNNTTQVSQAGLKRNGNYTGLLSRVLQTVYRINVGGPNITESGDHLWRQWVQDDPYLYTPSTAMNKAWYGEERPKYQQNMSYAATEFTAPDGVYKSAKISTNSSSGSNITRGFGVSKNTKHLVRLHFCDFFSPSLNATSFYLFLYNKYSQIINPYYLNFSNTATPFYFDYVVDSGNSEIITISICPRADSDNHIAYLNGLEIMQIMGPRGSGVNEASNCKVFDFVLVAAVVGSVIAGLALICTLVLLLKKNRKTKPSETSVIPGSSHSTSIITLNLSLKIPLAELESATRNFNEDLIIGKGGFGKVYSGKLSDGTKVAVKRSELWSGQGVTEFHTEINVLSRIRHRHLVSLIGYCDEGSEMILVYEFMEKGTLRDHLYNSKYPCLSWTQRLEICIGAAKGLVYLHTGSAGTIIHRDIKSTNILLDESHLAKVADFGISKLASLDETHISTGVKGTFGYYDPDYFRSYQLTEKSDVYSFGVVLLEALCARPPIDHSLPMDPVNLADWALQCAKKGLLEQIVDPLIKDQIDPNSLIKFWEIAERCLQENGSDRPTMDQVLWHLKYALQLQETSRHTDPLDDSATDCSDAFSMTMQSFPSISLSFAGDDTAIAAEDGVTADTTASEVFSQLKVNDAR